MYDSKDHYVVRLLGPNTNALHNPHEPFQCLADLCLILEDDSFEHLC